jgi:hypothetical protein
MKPGVGGGVPLHGGALVVAALLLGPAELADGVVDAFDAGRVGGTHADFFAVVRLGGSPGGGQERDHEAGDPVVAQVVSVRSHWQRRSWLLKKYSVIPQKISGGAFLRRKSPLNPEAADLPQHTDSGTIPTQRGTGEPKEFLCRPAAPVTQKALH